MREPCRSWLILALVLLAAGGRPAGAANVIEMSRLSESRPSKALAEAFQHIPENQMSAVLDYLNDAEPAQRRLYDIFNRPTDPRIATDEPAPMKLERLLERIQSDRSSPSELLDVARRIDDYAERLVLASPPEEKAAITAAFASAREEILRLARKKMDDLMRPGADSLLGRGKQPPLAAEEISVPASIHDLPPVRRNALLTTAKTVPEVLPICVAGHLQVFSLATGKRERVWIRDQIVGAHKTAGERGIFGGGWAAMHGVDQSKLDASDAARRSEWLKKGDFREYDLLADLDAGEPLGSVQIVDFQVPRDGHFHFGGYYLPTQAPDGEWSYPEVYYYGDNERPDTQRWTLAKVFVKPPIHRWPPTLDAQQIDTYIQLIRLSIMDNFRRGFRGRMEVEVLGDDEVTRFRILSQLGFRRAKKRFRGGGDTWYLPPEDAERFRGLIPSDLVLNPTVAAE